MNKEAQAYHKQVQQIQQFVIYFQIQMALQLTYRWVKSWFERSPINPERDCYNLDEECHICRQPVKPAICIKVCKCDKYAHYRCLIDKFDAIAIDTHKEPQCEVCHEMIKVTYKQQIVCKPKLELCLLLELLIVFCLLAWSCYLIVTGLLAIQNTIQKLPTETLLMVCLGAIGILICTGWMVILFKKILWKKQKHIRSIIVQQFQGQGIKEFPNKDVSNHIDEAITQESQQDLQFQSVEIQNQ